MLGIPKKPPTDQGESAARLVKKNVHSTLIDFSFLNIRVSMSIKHCSFQYQKCLRVYMQRMT